MGYKSPPDLHHFIYTEFHPTAHAGWNIARKPPENWTFYTATCALFLSAAVSALHQCLSSQSSNLKHVRRVPNNIPQDEGLWTD